MRYASLTAKGNTNGYGLPAGAGKGNTPPQNQAGFSQPISDIGVSPGLMQMGQQSQPVAGWTSPSLAISGGWGNTLLKM